MDKNASLSFCLGSGRGFLSDLQNIDLCSVTKGVIELSPCLRLWLCWFRLCF